MEDKVKFGDEKTLNENIIAYSIADFIDLSLVEVLTLQLLLRHTEPVVRHTLYLEVTQFLQSKRTSLDAFDSPDLSSSEKRYLQFLRNKKKLSTSSFYNNLKSLEKMGLISGTYNAKGKVEAIEKTDLTGPFMDVILRHFINFGVRSEEAIMHSMKKAIFEKIKKTSFENILVIWLNEFFDFQIIRIAYEVAEALFILSRNDFSKDLINRGLENVKSSSIYNRKIREPNEVFDVVFFPFYYKDSKIFDLNRVDLLKEAARVTKKSGVVIITAQSKLPKVEGRIASTILELYEKAHHHTIYEIDELEKDYNEAGFSKWEVFEHKGDLIGIGRVD
ncbi:hypothetical protein LCGC14_1360290 [marine sediment metagenome]|uniref:Uncharacterized protein n=1 Tax=marine sediment metagenome TaxID=412755 RepID=A0A0F9K8X1_9ZZZZ